ncbi:hypothetical protein IAQ61_000123 [Plenodomus lingam]|uniref:uncharacterized protein n=1 Tax=Leptosphaeria maculans TaxID=5022 RepID=UPI00332BBDA3|nr:hypothetical protein IAQ61_000123 [Plenodomus lingam]
MSAESTKALAEQGAAPLNFIYACSLCCATFADVYEGYNDSVQGLSDGINPKERLVTKLYLATCCHVLCSSHLEGGGPPFHPAGQRPRAPCPVCIKEKADREVRELYSVRGFNKDEYDPQIPPSWFTAPPFRLDGNGKEMEALRFQYIALIRYCQNTHATRKRMQNALVEAENNLIRVQNLVSEEYAKGLSLQQENQQLRRKQSDLEGLENQVQQSQVEIEQYRSLDVNPRDLETFRANKTAIRHYLKLVPMLLEQNEKMKRRLASLGFAMALKPITNFRELDPNTFDSDETLPASDTADVGVLARKTASSHTAGRSAHTSGRAATLSSSPSKQRPRKRQRQESPHSGQMEGVHPTSRDAMPPPPKPTSRMQSVRKLIPIIRRKYSYQGSTSQIEDVNQSSGDIFMVEHEHGNLQNIPFGCRALSNGIRGQTPYMSGALPVDEHLGAARPKDFQLSPLVDIQRNRSDLKSREAYPVKAMERFNDHEVVQLPTKPSYIYLMNGLSQHDEVEPELKDPSQEDIRDYSGAQARSQHSNNRSKWQLPGIPKKKRSWNIGQPFLPQSPQKAPTRPQSQMDPIDQYHAGSMDASGHAEHDQVPDDPTLPGPRRYRQSPLQAESVFKSFRRLSVSRAQDDRGPYRLA